MIPPFEYIFSPESILRSFLGFRKGKKAKPDVVFFSVCLVSNLRKLRDDLVAGSYTHDGYFHFKISDPKPRDIHKASVRDRVVHHALYRSLYRHFDRTFIHDSYSCRLGKGAHRAVLRFNEFARRESSNNTETVWILKCDIRKCFASVDHATLKDILEKRIACKKTAAVINTVIDSFYSGFPGRGIPLGNLTSQLFINIYMNEFDHYMKRILKTRYYIRYADDFVAFSRDKKFLENLIPQIASFLELHLKLALHPEKIFIKTLASGVDFLGWVNFPMYRVLRTSTKWRMFRNLEREANEAVLASYIGLLSHGNTHKLICKL